MTDNSSPKSPRAGRKKGPNASAEIKVARSPSPTSLELRFAEAQSYLNPRRQRLIRAMLDTPEETFYLSSRQMAKKFEVDAATIVRTIQAMGYERFADFAADLRRHFVTRITPYAVMKATAEKKGSLADQVRDSLERDTENLNLLKAALDPNQVVDIARAIRRSRKIAIVGVDLAASLAYFLAYGLVPLGFDAESLLGSSGQIHHKVRRLTGKDLLIAISFGRCLRQTMDAVLMARKRGVPTYGITDSDTTAIAVHCDSYLCASIASTSAIGSYVAPMALMNTIQVTCSLLQSKRSLALLRQVLEEYTGGDRWYEEPRRARTVNDGGARPQAVGAKQTGKPRSTPVIDGKETLE